jgi:hypothetical protein
VPQVLLGLGRPVDRQQRERKSHFADRRPGVDPMGATQEVDRIGHPTLLVSDQA